MKYITRVDLDSSLSVGAVVEATRNVVLAVGDGTRLTDAARAAHDAASTARGRYSDACTVTARTAHVAAYTAAAVGPVVLELFADRVVDILIDMDAPGVQWLPLCCED